MVFTAVKIKTFGLQKKYTRCEETFWDKIVHLKTIYEFTIHHFLIGSVVFVLTVKNVIKKLKILFGTKSMRDTKKML